MCCYVVLSNHVMRNCGNGLLFSVLITMVVWNIAVAIPSYCLLYTWCYTCYICLGETEWCKPLSGSSAGYRRLRV